MKFCRIVRFDLKYSVAELKNDANSLHLIVLTAEKRRLYDNRGSQTSSTSSPSYQDDFMRGHDPFTGFHASDLNLPFPTD